MFENSADVQKHKEIVCDFFAGGKNPRLEHIYNIAIGHYKSWEMFVTNPFQCVVDKCYEMLEELISEGKNDEKCLEILRRWYHGDVVDAAYHIMCKNREEYNEKQSKGWYAQRSVAETGEDGTMP